MNARQFRGTSGGGIAMTLTDFSEEVESENLMITPWKPITGEGDPGLTASKFSGIPWLQEDEQWPVCLSCDEPMQFILQVDLESLPEELNKKFGEGLVQFFYCTNDEQECEVSCESWFWNDEAMLVRLVKPHGNCGSPQSSPVNGAFDCLGILDWEQMFPEAPAPNEYSRYVSGDQCSYSRMPQSGDKLSGWPVWIQGVEYPECRECGLEMRLVFQLGSNKNVPYSWGSNGIGHITQCPDHKEILAFGWACS